MEVRLADPRVIRQTHCRAFIGYTVGQKPLRVILEEFRQRYGCDPVCVLCPPGTVNEGTPLSHIPVYPHSTRFILLGLPNRERKDSDDARG